MSRSDQESRRRSPLHPWRDSGHFLVSRAAVSHRFLVTFRRRDEVKPCDVIREGLQRYLGAITVRRVRQVEPRIFQQGGLYHHPAEEVWRVGRGWTGSRLILTASNDVGQFDRQGTLLGERCQATVSLVRRHGRCSHGNVTKSSDVRPAGIKVPLERLSIGTRAVQLQPTINVACHPCASVYVSTNDRHRRQIGEIFIRTDCICTGCGRRQRPRDLAANAVLNNGVRSLLNFKASQSWSTPPLREQHGHRSTSGVRQ